MKKNLKKIIGFTVGISALSIVTPIALASCTNNTVTVDETVAPKQIIDFSKYQEIVYKWEQDNNTSDPFAPIYRGQELYQFQYNLTGNNLDDATIAKVKEAFSLKEENISNTQKTTNSKKYFANRNFRDKDLINKLLSNLNFTLQTTNADTTKDKTLPTNKIDLDVVSNQNLESILGVTEDTTNNNRRNITWYVYPKSGKEWNVQRQETKNAYFSINFVPPKN